MKAGQTKRGHSAGGRKKGRDGTNERDTPLRVERKRRKKTLGGEEHEGDRSSYWGGDKFLNKKRETLGLQKKSPGCEEKPARKTHANTGGGEGEDSHFRRGRELKGREQPKYRQRRAVPPYVQSGARVTVGRDNWGKRKG